LPLAAVPPLATAGDCNEGPSLDNTLLPLLFRSPLPLSPPPLPVPSFSPPAPTPAFAAALVAALVAAALVVVVVIIVVAAVAVNVAAASACFCFERCFVLSHSFDLCPVTPHRRHIPRNSDTTAAAAAADSAPPTPSSSCCTVIIVTAALADPASAVVVAAAVGASEWAEEAEGVWVAVEVRGERGPRRAITEEEGDKDDEEKVDLDVDEAPSANARVAEEGDWTLLVVVATGVVEVVASSGRSSLSPAAL